MNPRYARLRPEMTVDEGIAYLRRQADQVETIYYGYVLDAEQRLLGVVTFRHLFSRIDIDHPRRHAERAYCRAGGHRPGSDRQLFSEHHLLAIPIVDEEGRIKGVVTVDDIVDVVEEEASEDIQKIGGMETLDEPYLEALSPMIRKRGSWLSALLSG